MRLWSGFAASALVGALAGCASEPAPPPAQRPATPAPRPAPPPPAPAPTATDWRDIPLSPGDWRYAPGEASSEAVFVMPGGGAPAFILRCDRAGRRITLVRPAGGGSQIRIRTSSMARALPGTTTAGGVDASLPASDALLDAIAFSRGRFTVESESGAMLVLPAWPEPARVVEDCR
jgi:hypothetical protein